MDLTIVGNIRTTLLGECDLNTVLKIPPDYKGNDEQLICLNCNDKWGWHHAKLTSKDPRICYGIGCMCTGFEHNLDSLIPLLEQHLK